jgi:murein DD-endopeptidase MepM/ murein hydrolase activator NlpD
MSMASLDDEVLPQSPADVATPFVFQASARTNSLFGTFLYPTQGGVALPTHAGELRGLYGRPGALAWHPEWSAYMATRPPAKTHHAVDIYAPPGTQLVAVCDGDLTFAEQPSGLGLYARLAFSVGGKHYEFHYGHLGAKVGGPRSVTKGAVIGRVGCSGNAGVDQICDANPHGLPCSSSHVHFALLPPQAAGAPKRSNPLSVLGWTLASPLAPSGL